ncbi:hypothetical protein [Bacteroides eggerthii]|jgi:hypothetical protein|uniref:hypothetical protein n=1 Tax=Bacteroides eggerthii TaxID=28111 RepID=UPI001106D880|nr:hypothetical protein [Bacteroides eggerthii]
MNCVKSSFCFYFILFVELSFFPLFYIHNLFQKKKKKHYSRNRRDVQTRTVFVETHEWAGYPFVREKKIKNGRTFLCGINFQLKRFELIKRDSAYQIDYTVTISDLGKYPTYDIQTVKSRCDRVLPVSNAGLDFSGYSAFYDFVKDKPNSYVILSNSSVNACIDDFLNDYIEYMENNLDVGMLGISYCTKMYQTLIRNNFTPHLQSFFLLTTIDVLRQVVAVNNNVFPGKGISNKQLLIREGEIRLSQLVMKLGYNLSVVNPLNGVPFKFTSYVDWSMPKGDIRQSLNYPNKITSILMK